MNLMMVLDFLSLKRVIKILLLANIVSLVDEFAHIMIDHKLSAVEAVRKQLSNKEKIAANYYPSLSEKLVLLFVAPEKMLQKNSLITSFF